MAQRRLVNNLRVLRFLANEMTQAELGERIGVTRQTIAAIEAGKYSPTLESAFRIAEVLGKPLEEVFQWKTEDSFTEHGNRPATTDSGPQQGAA
jgi:putative transcriptional regulator